MNLGFNAACFASWNLEDILNFASSNQFSHIEIECRPKETEGPHHIVVEDITEETAQKIINDLSRRAIKISCLSYYANLFEVVEEDKDYHVRFLKNVISAAEKLGVDKVSTFTGFTPGRSIAENLEVLCETMKPILSFAREKNVKIMLENSPLVSGQEFGGNFAYSPELWDMIFTAIPDEHFGLNYDPSHLFWLGVDYQLFINVFSERIFHVQAKDCEILLEKLRMSGILGSGWFRYRIPGSGSIDWKRFLSALYESGYNGVLSIENEDPIWLGSPEKAQRGILLGKKHLENMVV